MKRDKLTTAKESEDYQRTGALVQLGDELLSESWQLLDDCIKKHMAEHTVKKNSLRDYFAYNIGKEHHSGHNFGKKDITLGIPGHSIAVGSPYCHYFPES